MKTSLLVLAYLVAIVLANLSVAAWGSSVAIINAFLFIAFDLTSRDALHSAWSGHGLAWRMAALIGVGSALSYALNRHVGPIALASFVAFGVSAALDTITYHLLRARAKMLRVNGSNVVSAAADSLIFPALAFGLPLLWPIVVGQFVAKVAGGVLWSWLFRPWRGDL